MLLLIIGSLSFSPFSLSQCGNLTGKMSDEYCVLRIVIFILFLMKESSLFHNDALTFRNIASTSGPPDGNRDSRMIKMNRAIYGVSDCAYFSLRN